MFATCPNCGLTGTCSLTIVPGAEMTQDHVYIFKCDSCGHEVSIPVYAGSSIGNNPVTTCPHCGCDSEDHKNAGEVQLKT